MLLILQKLDGILLVIFRVTSICINANKKKEDLNTEGTSGME